MQPPPPLFVRSCECYVSADSAVNRLCLTGVSRSRLTALQSLLADRLHAASEEDTASRAQQPVIRAVSSSRHCSVSGTRCARSILCIREVSSFHSPVSSSNACYRPKNLLGFAQSLAAPFAGMTNRVMFSRSLPVSARPPSPRTNGEHVPVRDRMGVGGHPTFNPNRKKHCKRNLGFLKAESC